MKVFALTLLSLLALSQARTDYRLQCVRDEIGIRWPSYHSNSEYYVCQGLYGQQLTVTCPPGEVFTFVLQQCTAPALFVPAPPMNALPTRASITTHTVPDSPPMINTNIVHVENLEYEQYEPAFVHPMDPTPPTPPSEPPTPPTIVVEPPSPGKKPAAPAKKPMAPIPVKATAKKPAPVPAKIAKKPAPPKAPKKPKA